MAERNFFVLVSQLKDHGKLVREKSGRLWATNASQAEIEAGKYREFLNWASIEWMGEDFHIVMAVPESQVIRRPGHTKWWNNRVTVPNEVKTNETNRKKRKRAT